MKETNLQGNIGSVGLDCGNEGEGRTLFRNFQSLFTPVLIRIVRIDDCKCRKCRYAENEAQTCDEEANRENPSSIKMRSVVTCESGGHLSVENKTGKVNQSSKKDSAGKTNPSHRQEPCAMGIIINDGFAKRNCQSKGRGAKSDNLISKYKERIVSQLYLFLDFFRVHFNYWMVLPESSFNSENHQKPNQVYYLPNNPDLRGDQDNFD